MSDTIQIHKLNEVTLSIKCTDAQAMELYNFFAEYAPNYIWHPRYKAGFWDGKLRFFNKGTRQLAIGLLPNLIRFCTKSRYPYEFAFDPRTLAGDFDEDRLLEIYDEVFAPETGIYPRDYQHNSILKSLKSARGINRLSTGAGKSLIVYVLSRIFTDQKKQTIIVVPTVSLVEQMYSDFKLYSGEDPGHYVTKLYSGLKPDFEKPVLITTWQSIQTKHGDFFKRYQSLLIDECHQSKSLMLQEICKKCVNATYRLGFTGTMPDNASEKMTIIGSLGPVIYDLAAKTLIDRNVLSQIKIKNVIVNYPDIHRRPGRNFDIETEFLYTLPERNRVLDSVIGKVDVKQNSLVLVNKIAHLKEVVEYCKKRFPNHTVHNIYGDTDPLIREKIRQTLDEDDIVMCTLDEGTIQIPARKKIKFMDGSEKEAKNLVYGQSFEFEGIKYSPKKVELVKGPGESNIIVSTYATFSTGINVQRLHNIIFFSSYKSKIKILQSIGRGLRKHDSKDFMVLWDIVDDLRYVYQDKKVDNYIYKHWKARKGFYNEQGFAFEDMNIDLPAKLNTLEVPDAEFIS